MTEPAVALAFTPDYWVEELHRYLSDHGGARVRALVVDGAVALEEAYDVFVVGHRWPSLTRAFVADVRERGHAVLGVFDAEEHASRAHLRELGVDAQIASDAGADAIERAIVAVAGDRGSVVPVAEAPVERTGTLVVVGGPPGTGRSEIALHLAAALSAAHDVVLLDADDVAPSLVTRAHLGIEPNLASAVDAVEHGRGRLHRCLQPVARTRLHALTGLAGGRAWTQVRPSEVVRVVDRLAHDASLVVADGAALLEEVGTNGSRARYGIGRALVSEADVLVALCDPSPHGVVRLLSWVVDARALAPRTRLVVVVNRAPSDRFHRAELYDEIVDALDTTGIVFVPAESKVRDAAWSGGLVTTGRFARAIDQLALEVAGCAR